MGMLIHRRGATADNKKVTKTENVTPVEKKAKKTDEKKSGK
jgi:hypothetical protein